jgi:signal transduction histidine kinase
VRVQRVRVSVRLRFAALLALVVLAAGGALLAVAYALMAGHLHRTLAEPLASHTLGTLREEFALALAGAVIIAGGLGWGAAHRLLRPLREVTDAARRVTGSGDPRAALVAAAGPRDELRELADTFDAMLERLGDAFAAQRRFVAQASHELRRPLTVIRTELDVTLADPDAGAGDLRAMARVVEQAVDRCEDLVSGLLTLARGEGVAAGDEPADLARAARLAVEETRAEARSARLNVRCDLQAAGVRGDRRLLDRLAANLVENAVRHNVHGGGVVVRTRTRGDRALLTVENDGPVIAPERVPAMVEPFVRLGGGGPGSGLGLSIVRTVVRAHGGELALTPRAAGGLVAEIALPVRTAGQPPAARAAGSGAPATRA